MNRKMSEHSEMDYGKAEYIEETIETWIREGRFKNNDKLPSERELEEEFNVSRMTVRSALQSLEREGLVSRHSTKGTFITGLHEPEIAEELRRSGSFYKDMELTGHKPGVQWLEDPALVPASSEVAQNLQLPQNVLVFKRYRLQLADGQRYRLIKSFYPADLFGELLTTDMGDKPIFDWLKEQHKLRVVWAQEDLIARLATREERHLLQISPYAPVVALKRKVWADNDRIVEWANIIAVARLYTFSYKYEIPFH